MDWVLGCGLSSAHREMHFFSSAGPSQVGEVDDLIQHGLPTEQKRKRVAFEGSFIGWDSVPADDYLKAYGIVFGPGLKNRHQVYTARIGNLRVVVPALALIRSFFKPTRQLLPRMFSPCNIDEVSFVDYTLSPPNVVIDDDACNQRVGLIQRGSRQEASIKWAQTSKSARTAAQSVHLHALDGALAVTLPQGTGRFIFHGIEKGDTLYVNKIAMVSIVVSAEDSITGKEEQFIFHSMADASRRKTASAGNLAVPMNSTGTPEVTDAEWVAIEPMLASRTSCRHIHSQRLLLDGVLMKLAHKLPWKKVTFKVGKLANHVSAFRAWTTSNRLQPVLNYLLSARTDWKCGCHPLSVVNGCELGVTLAD